LVFGYRTYSIRRIREVTSASPHTIETLNFPIRTGEIVCTDATFKPLMTDDATKSILVHNAQIKNRMFVFEKPQRSKRPLYINYIKDSLSQPVILVNRGNGNNGMLKFEFCYLDPTDYPNPIQIENHLYKIYDNGMNMLNVLYKSLCDPRTLEFITHANGTGCLTAQFLRLVPVFDVSIADRI
jgi:hypothetical protein